MTAIIPENADRDFTASGYVVDDNKVLLLHHKKLGMWLQPGGHIEDDELPHETAKREIIEETGVTPRLDDMPSTEYDEPAEDLPPPFHVNAHQIEEGHWHCDFAYTFHAEHHGEATHDDEHHGTKWFTKDMLQSDKYDMPENVRRTALKALKT